MMIRRTTATNGDGRPSAVAITGGAGFIGTNLAHRLASEGTRVLVYDDLSRAGVEDNLRWLRKQHPDRIDVEVGCVTEARRIGRIVSRVDAVFHLAAQVAVTTSVRDPRRDFSVNLGGTMNLLEAMRALADPPHLVFTSTNKVYGRLGDMSLEEGERAYRPEAERDRTGVDEDQPLEFHSPYGCSKGAADQYVLDYARTFGVPTTVFRMSCIYGPHQHGTEDQGWVAHFMIRALQERPITIFGDGKQVRDVLYVSDLVEAFLLARKYRDRVAGRAFNIGGGAENAVSLLQIVDELEELRGGRVPVEFEDWRPGDQRWYVSDTSKFRRATGWSPRIERSEGLRRLHDWLRSDASVVGAERGTAPGGDAESEASVPTPRSPAAAAG